MYKSVAGHHRAMLPNPQENSLQKDTFEVGIAFVTAASSSADNSVTVCVR